MVGSGGCVDSCVARGGERCSGRLAEVRWEGSRGARVDKQGQRWTSRWSGRGVSLDAGGPEVVVGRRERELQGEKGGDERLPSVACGGSVPSRTGSGGRSSAGQLQG